MADDKPFKTAPDVGSTFSQNAFPSAYDQIGNVLAHNRNTIFVDNLHPDPILLEVGGSKEMMEQYVRKDVKHINLEHLTPAHKGVIDAYYGGEISDGTMKYYMTQLNPLGIEEFMLDDPVKGRYFEMRSREALADLIQNAKEKNIPIHGVNNMEGATGEDRVLADRLYADKSVADMHVVKAIEANPEFLKMDADAQYDFIRSTLAENMTPEQTDEQMQLYGLDVADENKGLSAEFLKERLMQDPLVANRILSDNKGEKSVTFYGGYHTAREGGDLDSLLSGSATVGIHRDKEAYVNQIKNKADPFITSQGFKLEQTPEDYSLDFKTGVWTDHIKGQSVKTTLPEIKNTQPLLETEPTADQPSVPQSQQVAPLQTISPVRP